MSFNKLIVLTCFVALAYGRATLTHLTIDNHPCQPERLKEQNRYTCFENGTVVCLPGWERSGEEEHIHPCTLPICEPHECVHGACIGHNICACKIGWEGNSCDKCIPMPGCQHGNCSDALSCDCFDGWTGGFCDKAVCESGCVNGECIEPNKCQCHPGFHGENCSICAALPGCVNGGCEDGIPNTCECFEGWTGPLCSIPKCEPECSEHGKCVSTSWGLNVCKCELGYQGDDCSKCRPLAECPNQEDDACVEPNDCICTPTQATADTTGFCGILH